MYERLAADVPAPLRHALVGLLLHADRSGVARISSKRLARFMGVSPRGAEKRLQGLRELGLIGAAQVRELPSGAMEAGYPLLVTDIFD